MKAIVLCAGLGTRLRPLTDATPKPMIEVGGKPLLHHHLNALRDAGVNEVAINLHHLPGVVENGTGDGVGFGMRIHYNIEPEPMGSAGALNGFPGFFDEPFFVVYGDVYHRIDYKAMLFFHATQRSTLTLATTHDEDPSQKGVVEMDAATGRVSAFVEKPPSAPKDSHTNAGLYLCDPSVAAMIPPGTSDFGSDIIPTLIGTGEKVYAYPTPSVVIDIGTPVGLARAREAANHPL